MNLDLTRLTRASVLVSPHIGRAGTAGSPKSDFGKKLAPPSPPADILTALDSVHQRIRGCSSPSQLADLLDEYIVLTARLAKTYTTGLSILPGGAVLTAAIGATSGGSGSRTSAG